jgi:hypothetical protein
MNRERWRGQLARALLVAAVAGFPFACGETEVAPSPGGGGAGGESGEAGVAGASGAGGAASFTTEVPVPCTSDELCRTSGRICDPQRFVCVDCRSAADCGPDELCSGGSCAHFTSCASSAECPAGAVCDPDASFCVECANDADCGAAETCVFSTCLTACRSNKTCIAIGLLCDYTLGACVDCLVDADCGSGSHCSVDSCEINVCPPRRSQCIGDSLLTCGPHGSGYSRETCNDTCSDDGGPHCVDAGGGGAGGGGGDGGTSGG